MRVSLCGSLSLLSLLRLCPSSFSLPLAFLLSVSLAPWVRLPQVESPILQPELGCFMSSERNVSPEEKGDLLEELPIPDPTLKPQALCLHFGLLSVVFIPSNPSPLGLAITALFLQPWPLPLCNICKKKTREGNIGPESPRLSMATLRTWVAVCFNSQRAA